MFEMEFGDIAKVLDGSGSATLSVFGPVLSPKLLAPFRNLNSFVLTFNLGLKLR